MTYNDLMDELARNAGDTGPNYKNDSRRRLNLVRSHIANRCLWRYALRPTATITTSSGTTSGIYNINANAGSDSYEFIAGDRLFDQTNDRNIMHESKGDLLSVDEDKSTTGNPNWWADAGADTNGNRQIYLWPVPDGTFTILFPAYLQITDFAASADANDSDAFFGPISPWGSTFLAGAQYYAAIDNNEDASHIANMLTIFSRQLERRMAGNRLSPTARMGMALQRGIGTTPMGQLDPAHFDNSRRFF